MGPKAAALVAGIIDRLEDRSSGTGRPPIPTIKVVETLRFFLREGVQWRELRATAGRACGSTLRRRLEDWSAAATLRRAHAALVRMVRAGPEVVPGDVVVDSRSVRAKRGGELTGPNPTDRGKLGTTDHVVVSAAGLPPAALPSAANVHDTRLFPHLLRLAQVVCAAIGRLHADAAYDSADNRGLCLRDGIQPCIRKVGAPHGSRPGAGPPRRRARLRVVAGRQAPGPAPGPARPGDPGPPHGRVPLHHRKSHQCVLRTVP
jgi:Transposase DDE domain